MRIFKVLAITILVVVIVSFGLFMFQLAPASSDASQKVDIKVTQGMSRGEVAHLLFTSGLIKNEAVFALYSKVTRSDILPGLYELSPSDSASIIIEKLATGDYKTVSITLIEGWRATDMEKYLVETKKLTQLKGFTDAAAKYEGYLFPDTYDIRADVTIDQLITELRDNFTKRTAGLKATSDVVILASIIEREAANDADRTAIAAVYLNRLKLGMPLDADPTIQYAKGNWQAVTLDDYKSVISPYSTYLHTGFPPGPISNPGIKSINAALNPDVSSYLYFFHAQGKTYFSKTLQEHNAKIAQYF